MKTKRLFGAIPGVAVGAIFENRLALSAAGVHRPLMAGISGSALDGADSIVLNGGYEDDEDSGEVIIYTGHGGNDQETGAQIADQELRRGNCALAKSHKKQLPVRVSRGWKERSSFRPAHGYRYDGLYTVERFWQDIGRSGYRIWRFRLVRNDPSPPPWER